MKKIKTIICVLRDAIRGLKFFPRTIITALASFALALTFAVAFEALYNFLASHSGMFLAAALIGGQVCLYAKELGRIGNGLKAMATIPTADGQTEVKQKAAAPKKEKAGSSLASFAQSISFAFSEIDDDDDDDKQLEQFSDDELV